MKKRKKTRRSLVPLIVLLIAALAVVIGVVVWKQAEYRAGEAFYDGLRGMIGAGRSAA